MTINVTPIPKLTSFVIPSVTIGAAAAAGSANTAIRSDSTIAGISLVGTTVDDSIVRFDGTAGQVQGYSSLSPTISNAGILSLTSGALKFPATEIVSSDANTMDDWETGTWTPVLSDTSSAVSKSQVYQVQVGTYTKIGNRVFFYGHLTVTDIGTLSGGAFIPGLPFSARSEGNHNNPVLFSVGGSLNITAGTSLSGSVSSNQAYVGIQAWDVATGTSDLTCAEFSDGGRVEFSGFYQTT